MRSSRWIWFIPTLLAVILLVGGCTSDSAASEEPPEETAARVEEVDDSHPPRIILTDRAQLRLGIETTPVRTLPSKLHGPATLVIPYSAVVYDADGKSWAFAVRAPLTYQRAPIVIDSIKNDLVSLSKGPTPGTQVVTVGAPELVGIEAGISGEE